MGSLLCSLGLSEYCETEYAYNPLYVNYGTGEDKTVYNKVCYKNCREDSTNEYSDVECKDLCHKNKESEDTFDACIRRHYTQSNKTCEEEDCITKCTILENTYNADADTWEMAPPLPFPVAGGAATTMDGGIVLRCLSRGVQHLLQYRDARWSEIEQEVPFKTASGFGSVLLG